MLNLTNWFIFLLTNGFALYSSWCLSNRALAYQQAPEYADRSDSIQDIIFYQNVIAAGVIYLVHITVVVLGLGVVLRSLNAYTVPLTSLLVSSVVVYFFKPYRSSFLKQLQYVLKNWFAHKDVFLHLVVVLFLLQAIVLLAKVIYLPPHIWDVFTYHLTPAVEWYQQGMIPGKIETPVMRMNVQPLGMTVLSYWFFIFFRDDFLVELPQLLWTLLLVPTSYVMMRQSGVDTGWSLKFAIVIFFIPIVLMQSITVKDHLGLNISLLIAMVFLSNFIRHREDNNILLAALAFGLALGYKQSAPVFPGIVFIFFIYYLFVYQKDILFIRAEQLKLLKVSGLSLLAMLLIGGYWYIRNIAYYGSVQGGVIQRIAATADNISMGTMLSHNGSISGLFGTGKFIANIKQFFPKVFEYHSMYSADLPGMSGFGVQFVTFGLIAVIVAVAALFIRRHRVRYCHFFVYAGLVLFIFYFTFYYSGANYRLFSFFPMIMIAYAAILLHWGGVFGNKISRTVINLIISFSILLNCFLILPPQQTNPLEFREFISLDPEYRTSSRYTRWFGFHRPNMYKLINMLPPAESIAYMVPETVTIRGHDSEDSWTYPYFDRGWKRRLIYLDQLKYFECKDNHLCRPKPGLRNELETRGISLVTVCESNHCNEIQDPDFIRLAPGLYYFIGMAT